MSNDNTFAHNLKQRIAATTTTRWIRFGFVTAIFIAWVIWMQSPWWLLALLLLFDIYITGFIPFTWWKKSKNPVVRNVMSWVDAIVYALILVYFVFNFLGQNYEIPSSSLEKTLLKGDYLLVDKVTYGPRVPMTPIHFPLVHNTLPVINTKSYLEWPSVGYRRLKGLRSVESGDIVVFNFPAGDTITTLTEASPEYYYLLVDRFGRERVHTDVATFGEVMYRPVDRRINFVKRAVGLPGERIFIQSDTIYINGQPQAMPEHVQFVYFARMSAPLTEEQMHQLGIAQSDVNTISSKSPFFDQLAAILGRGGYYYELPMTDQVIEQLKAEGQLLSCLRWDGSGSYTLFPKDMAADNDWSLSNYGLGEDGQGIWIPKKGETISLTPDNWQLYERCIRNYENHPEAYFDQATTTAYIDGKPAKTYTFGMDYYFMMGDNRHQSQDSRFWGFVPEDHIIGTPLRVLISFDSDRSIFNGGIRWNRIFSSPNPDK